MDLLELDTGEFEDSEMDQSGLTLTSLSTLLETDKKPWLEVDKKPWVSGVGVTGDACVVCGDRASGRHYGAISCEGCKGFFKRSIRKQLGYSCRGTKQCEVTKHHRNRCQYCRLQKCLQMGMRSDSVQHERKPLSNNQGAKRDVSEAALGSISPGSMYNNVIDGSSFNSRSEYLVYDNSFQDDEESESANDSDSIERTNITKAIETISSVISETRDTEVVSLLGDCDRDHIIPFTEEWTVFDLVVPTNIPNNGLVNLQYVCETASRLLFLSIHWVRSLPVFSKFSSDAQTVIVRAGWSDLFTIGLVQCQNLLPLTCVVSANLMHLQTSCTSAKLTAMADHVSKLNHFIKSVQSLSLDDIEYSALKAMSLFSSDRFSSLDRSSVLAAQEIHASVLTQLKQHLKEGRKDWSERLVSLLLILPQLRSIDSSVIEEVFFLNVLGSTSIDTVIPFILRVDSDDPLTISSAAGLEAAACENSNDEQRSMLTTSG